MPATLAAKDIEAALFNPQSGRLDAARIAKEMGVPVATIAGAIGRKAPASARAPMPAASKKAFASSIACG